MIIHEWHEWHGADVQHAPMPKELAERIAGWRETLYALNIPAMHGNYWQVAGIDGINFICITTSGHDKITEFRCPMFCFKPMRPWEIDRLRA